MNHTASANVAAERLQAAGCRLPSQIRDGRDRMTGDQGDELGSAVRHRSRGHLAWALPAALAVILSCAFVGLLRWCGDGQAETCNDPIRTRELYGDAIRWVIAGALIGGGILSLAPWGRVPARLLVGIGVAAASVGAGLFYLAL